MFTFRNSDFQNIKERKDIQWLLCLVSVGIKCVGILITCTGVVADATNERDCVESNGETFSPAAWNVYYFDIAYNLEGDRISITW